jgi:hypothetical protein
VARLKPSRFNGLAFVEGQAGGAKEKRAGSQAPARLVFQRFGESG